MKQLTLPNGKKIYYLDKLTALESYHEIYVDKDYFQYGLQIPKNAIVFDVGAHIGNFSRFIVEHYPSAHVYIFEPVPQIFEVLCANLNEYPDKIHSYNLGLGEKAGEVMIDYFPRLSATSAITPFVWDEMIAFNTQNWDSFTSRSKVAKLIPKRWRLFFVERKLKFLYKAIPTKCYLKPLSSIISELNIPKIDFLKIDAENYEDNVIAGITNEEHWDLIQQIAMEVHQHIKGGKNLITKFTTLLESKGFSVKLGKEFMAPGSNVFMLYAKR
ncbi:MAG: FkbM family methyltransferase [Candidatus Hermodarchaeota archaeon]